MAAGDRSERGLIRVLFDETDPADLPFPIARATVRLRRAVHRGIIDHVVDAAFLLVEEAVRLIAVELAATGLRAGVQPTPPIVKLLGKRRSFGDQVQLLSHLVRSTPSGRVAEVLRPALGKRGSSLLSRLEESVRLRNKFAHGPRQEGPQLATFQERVFELLGELTVLSAVVRDIRLMSVFSFQDRLAHTVAVLDWTGPTPASSERVISIGASLASRDLRPGTVLIVRDGHHFPLNPFMVARDDPTRTEPDLYVLETLTSGVDGLRASWVNLANPNRNRLAGGDDEVAAYRDLMKAWERSNVVAASRQSRLDSFYFASTPSLMLRLLERYTERRGVSEALERLFESGRSGTLWIVAGPGSGKSSVVASLVRRYEAVHHFVSPSEGRNNQPAIFRSLIAQLIRKIAADELPHEQEDLLPQQFSNLLVRRAMSQTDSEIMVVAVDALDELGDETAISRFIQSLPAELPDGVFMLVSSRPLAPGQQVTPGATQYVLDPLSVNDIQQVARMHGLPNSAVDCERAFIASHGNPLLAVWALTLLRDSPDIDFSGNHEFDDILSPLLARPMLGPNGGDVVRLLAVLTASRIRLDLATLAGALARNRPETLHLIGSLRDVLTVDRRGVLLSHHAVREYLTRPSSVYGLDASDLRSAHQALYRLAVSRPGSLTANELLWHAINSKDEESLRAALGDDAVRREFGRTVPELAALGEAAALTLLELVQRLELPWSHRLVSDGAQALALAGYWKTAAHVAAAPWAASLPDIDLAFIRLEVARTSDSIEDIGALADQLLESTSIGHTDRSASARLHFLKGESARVHGYHDEALTSYERAVALAGEGTADATAAEFQLADLLYVHGRLEEAGDRLAALLTKARTKSDLVWETRILREIGHLDLSRGRHELAAEWYGRALDLALATGRKKLITQCYASSAEALVTMDPARALELAERGIEHGTAAGAATELGKVRASMAEAELTLGRTAYAIEAASRSLRELIMVGYGSGQARAKLVRARALCAAGDFVAAAADARDAFDYYRRERIYPHLWRCALLTWSRAEEISGGQDVDRHTLLAEIPHLDQIADDKADCQFPASSC